MPRIARLLPLMMAAEPTTSDVDWTQLQGTVLEGGYQLDAILGAEESEATFKVRVLGDAAASALARVFVADAAKAEEQAAAWQKAKQLHSRELARKHLATPLSAGQTQIDGATLAYVILRRPDETLGSAIAERALSKAETSEVLVALVRALEELHAQGLVHGCVSPEQIVAMGNLIQLSTECVRNAGAEPLPQVPRARYRAPESGSANITPEADVWCVGATLIEVLTQKRCGQNCMEQAAALPAPFDNIVRRCLEPDPGARIKLGQVEALLRGQPQPQADATKAALAARNGGSPGRVSRPVTATAASAAATIPMRAVQEPKLRAWWMYAAAGIVVVVGLIWLLSAKHGPRPQARQVATAPAATPATAPTTKPAITQPQGSAWESKTITPEESKTTPHPQPATPKPAAAERPSQFLKGSVWRVVLYTYTRQADADSKARWVNAKYPGLNAETFSPSGGSPYLVVAGGRMSRDDAARLRQKVRSLGLPRDSYIQNYQQ